MKPDFAVVVKSRPSVCNQKMTTSTRPSQMPSTTPRRTIGMCRARTMANIASPATMKRRLVSAPTVMPPLRAMRIMGKPNPHTVATDAMVSTARAWRWRREAVESLSRLENFAPGICAERVV